MLTVDTLNATVGDFQRNYLYMVNISKYPTAIKNVFDGADSFVANVDLYCHKFSVPEDSTSPIEVRWAGMWAWFDGPQKPQGYTTLAIRCDRSYQALNFFKAWKGLTGDSMTGVALTKMATIGGLEILMVDVDKTTVLQRFVLKNISIKKVDPIELEKAGEKEVEVQLTVYYEGLQMLPGKGTV